MAQTGYTPILIYSSSTTTNAPAAGSLTNSTLGSELAINITDGKLFYKDNANAVQVIAWKVTPTTAGGTGLTSYSQGDLLYYNSGTTLTALAKNTSATRYLSNTGSSNNPAWAQVDLSNGVTGTLPVGNGGTGNTTGAATAVKSNATTGLMEIVGPGTGTTRVMTIPNANFTAARTDAAQTFTGLQTLNDGAQIPSGQRLYLGTTGFLAEVYYNANGNLSLSPRSGYNTQLDAGNLVIATSGKGIDFSATPGTGTSELLADYEEGTWTPVLAFGGGSTGITYTSRDATYTKVGRLVRVTCKIVLSSKGSSTGFATLTGLPFSSGADTFSNNIIDTISAMANLTAGGAIFGGLGESDNTIYLLVYGTVNRTTVDETYFQNTSQFSLDLTYSV